MDKAKLNYIVTILLLVSTVIVVVTGIMKIHGFLPLFGLDWPWGSPQMTLLSRIHDWSGIVMSVLVLFHLYVYRKVVFAMSKQVFK